MKSADDLIVEDALKYLQINQQRDIPSDLLEKLQNASDRMHLESLRVIGCLYEHGISVPQSISTAYAYYCRAASLGLAPAIYNVGIMLSDELKFPDLGVQLTEDQRKQNAIEAWEIAAKLGDTYSLVALGIAFESGWYVNQDLSKARSLYEQSIKLGNTEGAFRLALLQKNVSDELEQAKSNFRIACESGHMGACYELGYLIYTGIREPKIATRESLVPQPGIALSPQRRIA